jgi:precorrin-6y C5,15-methyltransferase (decarboxylating) CbiE subunit
MTCKSEGDLVNVSNTIYIVGVGPGSTKYLTEKAKEIINKADIVVGWELALLPVEDLIRGKEVHLQSIDNYVEVAEKVAREAGNTNKTVAVLRVGDPCISSGLTGLLKIFDGFNVEIVPGISSIQIAAAIAKVNIDESLILSFHDGGNLEEKKKLMVDTLRRGRHIIMLVGPNLSPNEAAKYLIANGISENTQTIVCENLTLEDQKIFKGTLRNVLTKQFSWLSVMVVISPKREGA